ncbi:MAG: hypothetical protein ACLTXI_02690 [Collinsella sp.]
MTSDKKRRGGKKLREQAENSYFTLMQWWDHLQLTVMGKVYLTAPEKVYFAIAEIDRPTCTIIDSYQLITPGLGELDLTICAASSFPAAEVNGYEKPHYCSECGAVVIDED